MKFDDEAFLRIQDQISSLSVHSVESFATAKSNKSILSVKSFKSRKNLKNQLIPKNDGTEKHNPHVLAEESSDEKDDKKSTGSAKTRRQSLPFAKHWQGASEKSPKKTRRDRSKSSSTEDVPESFGSVPSHNRQKRHFKKILSPKASTKGQTNLTQETRRRYFMTKTSIIQHSLHVDSNDEFDADNSTTAYQDDASHSQQRDDTSANAIRGNSRTEESIECIFTTMSYHDPDLQKSKEQDAKDDVDPSVASSLPGGTNGTAGPSENAMIAKSKNGDSGSFFYLCGNPDHVDSGNIDEGWASNWCSLPYGNAEHNIVVQKKKREPTVVHVTDIVSQKRDFTTFLEAYDELLRRSKEQTPLRELELTMERTISVESKNSNRLCTFCPKTTRSVIPPTPPPSCWPQYPICLRATPQSGMRIIGVRFSSSSRHMESPCWWKDLGMPMPAGFVEDKRIENRDRPTCDKCQLLPINSGFEPKGKSLVIDFESELFVGTLMMRIKNAKPLKDITERGTSGSDYFGKANRKYQAVIRGEFKKPILSNRTVTGQVLPHEVTNLPSKWVLKTAVSIISVFAPQLQANFDGGALEGINGPSFVSPLASTPQAIISQEPGKNCSVDDLDATAFLFRRHANEELEIPMEEPDQDSPNSLVAEYAQQKQKANASGSAQPIESRGSGKLNDTSSRAKARKKCFDKQFAKGPNQTGSHIFETNKIYTFEFLQHLLNFETFTLEVGTSLKLNDSLNGQPLQFMAATLDTTTNPKLMKLNKLWSFDVWHQGLYQDAVTYESLVINGKTSSTGPNQKR